MIDQKSQQQLAAWGYGTLVQRELTRDALLAKEPGLTPEQAEQAIPAWLQRQGLKTQAEAQRWIQSYGLAEEDSTASTLMTSAPGTADWDQAGSAKQPRLAAMLKRLHLRRAVLRSAAKPTHATQEAPSYRRAAGLLPRNQQR